MATHRIVPSRAAAWGLAAICMAGVFPAPVRAKDERAARAAPRRPMTFEDLWAVQRVGAPAVSPDGRWVAFTVTTYSMSENKGQGDLWLADAAGREAARRLTWNKGPDTSPAWSPDGKRLA